MAELPLGGRDRGDQDLTSDPGNRDLDGDGARKDLLDDPGIRDLVQDPGAREMRALDAFLNARLPSEIVLKTAGSRAGGFVPRRRSP